MNAVLEKDLACTTDLLQQVKDFSAAFLSGINERPVKSRATAFPPLALPAAAAGAAAALQQFMERYEAHLAANAGARYWGFVTGGATPAALAGDWLTAVLDMNAADKDAVAFDIETETIALLRQLFGLPAAFSGSFVSGATMSNFTALATARQWAGLQLGVDVAQSGMAALAGLKVLSCTPHSSTVKSLALSGFGRDALVKIPSLPGRESVDLEALEAWLQQHGNRPFIFVAAAGTVNTVDFDDIATLAALKKKYNFWLHVDAAFGGFAACHEACRHLLQGWEEADSITIDAHKWLNVPYDSAMIFCRHPALQLQAFKNAGAAYLGDPEKDFRYSNYTPENSRRLRALPAWCSLMAYGAGGYRAIVENNVQLAQQLGTLIGQHASFRLLSPVRLCVACFTLNVPEQELEAAVAAFLAALEAGGKVMMTPTVYQGLPAIRAALVNWRTTGEDVRLAWKEMEKAVQSLAVSS